MMVGDGEARFRRAGRRLGVVPLRVALVVTLAVASAAAAWGLDGDAVVIVNGQPIGRQRIVDLLLEAHGLEAMQQLILLELAKQETQRLGIRLAAADTQAEFERSLDRIAGPDAAEQGMGRAEKLRALELLLEQKGLSMAEFMVSMERNAHLRKLVEKDLEVSAATLREEFARTYGERVRVRHIQIPVEDTVNLQRALDALRESNDFAEVARHFSRNAETAARGGEMTPFTFDDANIPPLLREAAFSLAPGEVSSPVRVEKMYHILKLEGRIEQQNVRFEDVRATVESRLRERVIPQRMGQLASELFAKAKIRVIDGKLKQQFDELLRRGQSSGGVLTP